MAIHYDESRLNDGPGGSKAVSDPKRGEGYDHLALIALSHIADQRHRSKMSTEDRAAMRSPAVTALAHALADASTSQAEDMVSALLKSGVSVEQLCSDHLAPAARELGVWWETDDMPFTVVTLATARIQAILRQLPGSRTPVSITEGKGAIFAAVPGEEHTLGVLMAADHFRRLGWDVGVLIGMEHTEMRARILDDDRPLLGLSCTSSHAVEALRRLVDDVRHRRPDLAIVLSGRVACDDQTVRSLPEFDGLVIQLDGAERILKGAVKGARPQSPLR